MEERFLPIKYANFAHILITGYWRRQNYQKNQIIGLNFMFDFYLLHSNLLNRGDPFHPMILVVWMTDDYQIQPSFMSFYNISKFLHVTSFHRKWLKCSYPLFTISEKKPSSSINVQICQK